MKIEDGKKIYEDIEIPEELSSMVEGLIKEDRKKKDERKVIFMFKRCAAAAAAVLVVFTAGLNTSQVFAENAAQLPVIGAIAKVLTIRSYHQDEGDLKIDMEVPAIEAYGAADSSGKDFTALVNAEIEKIVDDYTNEARAEFEEYKEAFFATGGTKEEWADRQMDIIVDYDVKYQQSPVLSLELITAKGWVSASEERHYYNIDVLEGRELRLSDVLGEDYVSLCNTEIDRQIKEQLAADQSLSYFGYGDNDLTEAGFKTVDKDTDFYINKEGQVVIVFPEYSIAPGYMGFREFTAGEARL